MRKPLRAAAAALSAAALAAGLTVAATAPAAGAPASPSSTAPECVHITVQSLQSDGTTVNVHYWFCGSGPGGDSALHDWVDHDYFILDGGGMPGVACGGWSDPCVVFPR